MDDASRRALEQALHDMRSMAQQRPQVVQPEQHAHSPRPYPSEVRIFSPVPLPSHEQSQTPVSTTRPAHQGSPVFIPNGVVYRNATTTSQSQASTSTPQTTRKKSTVFLPNGGISYNIPPVSQVGTLMSQHAYQPAQQQRDTSLHLSHSLNNTTQRAYQPTQMRPGAPHGQFNRGPYQPRHHPYGAPSSRGPPGLSGSCSQVISQVPLTTDSKSSPDYSCGPVQPQVFDMPQVRTPDDQNRLYRLYESRLRQGLIDSQAPSPSGVELSPRDPTEGQVLQTSQSIFIGGLPLSGPHIEVPAKPYGRIQLPTQNPSRAFTQNPSQAPTQSPSQAAQPSIPKPEHRPQIKPRAGPQASSPLQDKTIPVTERSLHTSPPNISKPSRPHQASPQFSPSPPRVWRRELQTVTYELRLQAQPVSEADHPSQKELADAMQMRCYKKLRPHEFMDYLTMEHNARFKSAGFRVYDMLFMQMLLFANDQVLLVSRKLQTQCWEPPQSIWHVSDVSGLCTQALILEHMFKALNNVSDLQPGEIARCADHQRYDTAVNIVKENGSLIHGWSTTISCEIKPQFAGLRLRNCSQELHAHFFNEKQVESLRMDPVWKAKVLKIFEFRRKARHAKREDSLMNR